MGSCRNVLITRAQSCLSGVTTRTRTAIGSKARSFRSLTRRGSTLTTDCDRLHRTRRARGGADECSELESPERAESPRADAAEAADEEALRISAPVSA